MAKGRRSTAPDELTPEDFDRVAVWCHRKFPWWERDLDELIETCLEHHGGKGTLGVDWAKLCMTWIRRHDGFKSEVGRGWRKRLRDQKEIDEMRVEVAKAKEPRQLELGMEVEVPRPKGPLGGILHEVLRLARSRMGVLTMAFLWLSYALEAI